jgi:acyl dehydratase
LKAGASYLAQMTVTASQVIDYMQKSGDLNPIHWDEEYCSHTFFKTPIVHGTYMLGFLSRILGTEFPGKGTVVAGLTSKFLQPLKYEQGSAVTVAVKLEVAEVDEKRKSALINYVFTSAASGQDLVMGTVTVRNVWDITRKLSSGGK